MQLTHLFELIFGLKWYMSYDLSLHSSHRLPHVVQSQFSSHSNKLRVMSLKDVLQIGWILNVKLPQIEFGL